MPIVRDTHGFGLIEVVVSAFLTVLIAGAVLTGVQAASRSSGATKAQSIASSLAQQDQERLRAMPVANLLPVPPQTAPQPQLDGVSYTVRSESVALKNAEGAEGCTAGGSGLVKIVSTVTWQGRPAARRPIRVTSLVARPFRSLLATSGSALLVLDNADGAPVTGQAVTVLNSSSAVAAGTTDSQGCAYFPDLPSGSYTFAYKTIGWVDPDGVNDVRVDFSIAAQQLTTKEQLYDQAGYVPDPTIETRVLTTPTRATQASQWPKVRLVNGSTERVFNTKSGALGPLFPFPSDYAIHTGSCSANAGLTPADVASIGPTYSQSVRVPRGGTSPAVKLFQPSIDVYVTNSGGTAYGGAKVIFTPLDPGCTVRDVATLPTQTVAPYAGRLQNVDMGIPYGSYSVCAVHLSGLPYGKVEPVPNTLVGGTQKTVALVTSTTKPAGCVP